MSANTAPVFALTPNNGKAVLAAANTARDGSGTLVTLITAGSNGGRLDWIKWASAQASAAALSGSMVARVWITDAAFANPALLVEGVITSATASNTIAGAWGVFDFLNGLYINTAGTAITIGINGGVIVDASKLICVTQSIYAGVQDRMSITSKYGDF
jgi:hypothetical protein